MYLAVINKSRKMGCTCEPTRTLATLLFFFSGLKSVCCQLSQLLWPSFQNNTFNSCMSLIIQSRFFFFRKAPCIELYAMMCDDTAAEEKDWSKRIYCSGLITQTNEVNYI